MTGLNTNSYAAIFYSSNCHSKPC